VEGHGEQQDGAVHEAELRLDGVRGAAAAAALAVRMVVLVVAAAVAARRTVHMGVRVSVPVCVRHVALAVRLMRVPPGAVAVSVMARAALLAAARPASVAWRCGTGVLADRMAVRGVRRGWLRRGAVLPARLRDRGVLRGAAARLLVLLPPRHGRRPMALPGGLSMRMAVRVIVRTPMCVAVPVAVSVAVLRCVALAARHMGGGCPARRPPRQRRHQRHRRPACPRATLAVRRRQLRRPRRRGALRLATAAVCPPRPARLRPHRRHLLRLLLAHAHRQRRVCAAAGAVGVTVAAHPHRLHANREGAQAGVRGSAGLLPSRPHCAAGGRHRHHSDVVSCRVVVGADVAVRGAQQRRSKEVGAAAVAAAAPTRAPRTAAGARVRERLIEPACTTKHSIPVSR
jgi:hypothetical protein